jgi:hypothetical protein
LVGVELIALIKQMTDDVILYPDDCDVFDLCVVHRRRPPQSSHVNADSKRNRGFVLEEEEEDEFGTR